MAVTPSRVVAALIAACFGLPAPALAQETSTVTVMSRNLYLGADVGPAMELLPDLSAAATFMWEQVHATDFAARSAAIATEVVRAAPDVLALQEATTWSCAPHVWSRAVPVFDFTTMLLQALDSQGARYAVAEADGRRAVNPGFSIGPIPGLTTVHDPEVFQPLFGTDDAACGFRIADTLIVREGVDVERVGTTEFETAYSVVPLVMTVHRGYSWADIRVDGSRVRVVTTHLESLFDDDSVPPAKHQADQLVADLAVTTMPLVVAGDFNSDPRDPRSTGSANPGEQPEQGGPCLAQRGLDATCSAYWTMRAAGYIDAGPDAADNPTWGFTALLTGPDPARPSGMTDRLDYVFLRGGVTALSARVVDGAFPTDVTWSCGTARCAPSDHAGLVVSVAVPIGGALDSGLPPTHAPGPLTAGRVTVLVALGLAALAVRGRVRATRSGRAPSIPGQPG